MDSRFKFETRLLAVFGLAMLVVVALAASSWHAAQESRQAAQWVAHSHEVKDHLDDTESATLLTELSMQNYRLTGDTAYLAALDAPIAEREISLRRISELTAGNPRQQERWAQLRATVDERLAIFRRTDLLHKTEGAEAARAYAAAAPLQETRERLYRTLRELDKEVLQTFPWVGSTLSRTVCKEDVRWTVWSCTGNCLGLQRPGR